jgi:hypothetical protein
MTLQNVVSGFSRTLPHVSRTVLITLAVLTMPAYVFAQRPSQPRTEIGGDLRWLTGVHFNDVNANETAFGGATRTVFKSSTAFEQAVTPEAKVLVRLISSLDAEGSIALGRSHLTTKLTQDPEALDATVSEPVTVYLLEAGVAAHLARWRRGRAAPFASAGIGYLRQLHDTHAFVEGGRSWYVGGGLRYPLRDRAVRGLKSAALRLELRATILSGDSTVDGDTHLLPAVIAGVFFHF